MKYSDFGNTGEKISRLGFGAMRLPGRPDDDSRIDEEKSVEMLCRAFDLGVNLVDTAYAYRGGQSEEIVGKALRATDQKILTCSKFPLTDRPKAGEFRRKLETSLKRTGLEQFDFYYFHGIGKTAFDEIILPQGFLEDAVRAKEEGLIRHISFSFHDEPEYIKYIIDRGEIFESILCQYNILFRQNEEMMAYAKSRGLGVAVMGPLAGGKFVVSPEAIAELGDQCRISSTADLGLRFVLNNPNVDVVLSGMKNIQMLEENVEIVSGDTTFGVEDQAALDQMIQENSIFNDCYCTECCYCLPCPKGINIPYVFRLLNFHKVDHLTDYARAKYMELKNHEAKQVIMLSSNVDIGSDPQTCIECGKCMKKCPQHLKVPEKLKEAKQIFDGEGS